MPGEGERPRSRDDEPSSLDGASRAAVREAFDKLLVALDQFIGLRNADGAEAMKASDYSKVNTCVQDAAAAETMRERVGALSREWSHSA